MNKTFRLLSLLIITIICGCGMATAQMMPQLPTDPQVRIGKLPNGLTYYIRHNEYPKGQADYYIAQKVGSMQEEESQRGLAHFLEHMCFNGTTNFPEKNLINYLESVGVKFGANLNAYTYFDETVYNISNVPVNREGVQDSCLLVLHDWANDLLLEDEEIDAERAVIHEEWRSRNVGSQRIMEENLPKMFPGSKYGTRLPIGTMDVVDNFPYQVLRDYYEKWYRPDLQGIVVVGDIDVDSTEAKIKRIFSDIEMPANAAERVYYDVPDTKGTIYAIGHDKEMDRHLAQLFIKTDALPDSLRNTPAYYASNYMESMIAAMLNERLNDISSKPDAPFAASQMGFGKLMGFVNTKDAATLAVLSKDADIAPAMAAAYRELLRAVRGGFTVSEYERARSNFMSGLENAYNNRNKRQTSGYVNEYVRNFLDGNPIPGIETSYQIYQMLSQAMPVDAINAAMKEIITPDNRILMVMLPDNAEGKYPTEEDFSSALASVEAEDIEPMKEELKKEPLIPQLPAPGKIVGETHNEQWDATEWTLSNGIKVLLKPTTFKDDQILFWAGAVNGTSEVPDDKANSLIFMPVALSQMGLGTYSNSDLTKYLAGKIASIYVGWDDYVRTMQGMTTPKDVPTLMELIYMTFTGINFTPEEFEAMQKQYAGVLHSQEKNPEYIFQTKVNEALFSNPRNRELSVSAIEGASREEIIEISRQMTANAAEYTFIFIGNLDMEAMKPLVEQYIATLPADAATARHEVKAYNKSLDIKGGKGTDRFTTAMETPQTYVYLTQFGDIPYSQKSQQLASVAGQILSKRLLDTVREKEGAVYSISARGSLDRIGDQRLQIESSFPMKPEMKDKVLGIIENELAAMTQNIKPEELAPVKEFMVKSYTEARENNNGWLSGIAGWTRNGVDTFNGATESMNAITIDEVMAFVSDLLKQGNYRVVILDPAE